MKYIDFLSQRDGKSSLSRCENLPIFFVSGHRLLSEYKRCSGTKKTCRFSHGFAPFRKVELTIEFVHFSGFSDILSIESLIPGTIVTIETFHFSIINQH
jgi:hypothetical protein